MPHRLRKVLSRVEGSEKDMVEVLKGCISHKAVGPLNGGEGEREKADYIEGLLRDAGLDSVERVEVPDPSVPGGSRPNLIARLKGGSRRTLWYVSHMDVVPEGDRGLWKTEPFKPVVKGGKVFGRGAEDNGQDLVASMFALKALVDEGVEPLYDLACLISADEETGSRFGVKAIIKDRPKMFGKKDLIIVPDAPTPSGEMIEVAEKSILWLKVTTVGQQCHASTPEKGVNAHKAAAKYITMVDEELYFRFNKKEELYTPPVSTFEVTKKDNNVGSVNIIPGEDVVFFDNRILPEYRIDEVLAVYEEVARKVETEKGVRFRLEEVQRDEAAPPTQPTDDISRLTARCVRMVYDNKPFFGGIGGGTYAAMFRRAGIPAVVWGKGAELAHQPNEYCIIENLVGDSKVFAAMALTDVKQL